MKFAASPSSAPPHVQATQTSTNNPKTASSGDKKKEGIILIYQQYLVLKSCEANSNGLINLNATRAALKQFDSSIRAKGYDPDALFKEAKEVPFNEAFKILLVSVSLLPMAQGEEKAQLITTCQRMIESEAHLINLAVSSGGLGREQLGEKDF